MIAARLLSWQLCWEGGNGVSRCCKENETALVRPRFRSFAALCALSRQKPQLRKLQPYSHILTFTVLYFLKWYCDHFFLSLNPFLYLFFLFHLNDKKILHVRRVSFFYLHAKEQLTVNVLTSVKHEI